MRTFRMILWFCFGVSLSLFSAWAMADNRAPCTEGQTNIGITKSGRLASPFTSYGSVYVNCGATSTTAQACAVIVAEGNAAAFNSYYHRAGLAAASKKTFTSAQVGGSGGQVRINFTYDSTGASGYEIDNTEQSSTFAWCTDPPPIVECIDIYVGTKLAHYFGPTTTPPDTLCDDTSHCTAERQSGSTICTDIKCGALYKIYLDDTCVAGENPPPSDDAVQPAPAEECVTNAGAEYCISSVPDGENAQCGYLNDQFVCLAKTPEKGCQSLADGSVVCDTSATPPQAPDNGTPGVSATPTGTVKANTSPNNTTVNEYNYFNAAAVTGSSRAPATGQVDTGNDSNGDGVTDPDEESGSPCSGADCFEAGTNEETPSFGARAQTFYSNVSASPFLAAVGGIGDALPAGTCPTRTFTLFGASFVISPSCDVLDGFLGVLYVVALAGWALIAVRIVLEA